MELFNFGGATAIIEHCGVRMLMDPWLDDGIFHGSWVHFPPLGAHVEDVGRLDYIYISHIHEDHCSLGTLERLDRNAVVFVMGRKPNFVVDFRAQQAGVQGHTHHPAALAGTAAGPVADMVEPDPDAMASAIDSALILRWDRRHHLQRQRLPAAPGDDRIRALGLRPPRPRDAPLLRRLWLSIVLRESFR